MNQVPCHARSGARPAHPRGRGGERGESGGIRFRRREIQCFGGHRPRGLPGGAGRIGGCRRPAGTRRAWNYRSEVSSAEFIRRVVPRGFAWRCPVGPRGDAPDGGRETGKTSGGRPAKWVWNAYVFCYGDDRPWRRDSASRYTRGINQRMENDDGEGLLGG